HARRTCASGGQRRSGSKQSSTRKRSGSFSTRDVGSEFSVRRNLNMSGSSPSALITDQGQRVLLRIQGRFYELSQDELRTLLGLLAGRPGLGITIEGDSLRFEFAADG